MNTQKTTLKMAYIALMAALLSGGKIAMSALPNIEPVTILIMVFSASFGWQMSIISAMIFCTQEALIFGFGSWVIGYYVYWCLLAVVAGLVLKKHRNTWIALTIGIAGTLFYGFFDAIIYACFIKITGNSLSFFKIFAIYYVNGFYFVLLQLASTIIMVLCLFKPLTKLLDRLAIKSGINDNDITNKS